MRNFVIQLLESGKALCAKNFPLFVDAWNWMNQSLANLRGDYDLSPNEGYITVDDSAGFPVIRLTNLHKLKSGTGSVTSSGYPQCYDICTDDVNFGKLLNCYLVVGGQIVSGIGGNVADYANEILCIRIQPSSGDMGLHGYDTFEDLLEDQSTSGVVLCPLYALGNVEPTDRTLDVAVDFRNMFHADVWSAYP